MEEKLLDKGRRGVGEIWRQVEGNIEEELLYRADLYS
jgi:hypothetical protein